MKLLAYIRGRNVRTGMALQVVVESRLTWNMRRLYLGPLGLIQCRESWRLGWTFLVNFWAHNEGRSDPTPWPTSGA